MTTPMLAHTIPEAVEMAADHLETHGWQRGSFGDLGGPCCADGALRVVTCGSTEIIVILRHPNSGLLAGAELEVAAYLGGGITAWNDDPDQIAEVVIDALRRCATHLRGRL